MNRISKLILIVLATVFGLLVMSFIGANLYLQSSEVQTRIRNGVQKAIGAPLQIRGSSLTPWSGLTLSGLSVNDPDRPEQRIFEAKSVNARLNWWRLLTGGIEVTSVTMNDPIVIVESGRTKLELPSPRQEIPVEASTPLPPTASTPTPDLSPPAPLPARSQAPAATGPKPLRIAVRHFGIENGTFILKDKNGWTQVELKGLEMSTTVASETEASGTIRATEILLARQFPVHKARAEYILKGDQLEIPRITGEFAQGQLTGNARSHLPSGQSAIAVSLIKSSVKAVMEDAGLPSEGTTGDFGGNLELAGIPGQDDTYIGKGDFDLVSGTLKPLDFIQKMGQLFQIEELQLLQLETATLRLTIGNRRTQIEELTLKSKNLILSGIGPVKFDGRLDLDAQLKINPKLQRNLQSMGLLNKNFTKSDIEGYKQVAFNVGGTLRNPNSDILDKLTGIKLGNDLGTLLQGLFSAPKKKDP